jgi:hypothetical protein
MHRQFEPPGIEMDKLLKGRIDAIAPTISGQALGLPKPAAKHLTRIEINICR